MNEILIPKWGESVPFTEVTNEILITKVSIITSDKLSMHALTGRFSAYELNKYHLHTLQMSLH